MTRKNKAIKTVKAVAGKNVRTGCFSITWAGAGDKGLYSSYSDYSTWK